MRAPVDHIEAPAFPARLPWFNSEPVRVDQLRGRLLLIEFWDFCRPNSIRTLPYIQGWHDRYGGDDGLAVIGVHASGFPPSASAEAVGAAVARLGVRYPVVADLELEIWRRYGNLGWPARYLFGADGRLFSYHYGEGAYEETELEIQQLLGVEREPIPPVRAEDAPDAMLERQSEDVSGPYRGPYTAGGVWAVLDGDGVVAASGRELRVDHPGAYELVSHPVSADGELELVVGDGRRMPRRLLHPRPGRLSAPGGLRRHARARPVSAPAACSYWSRLERTGGPSSSTVTQNPAR